jgi:type I restriction-modification system DNA methylase subunit
MGKSQNQAVFGDFQTPLALARDVAVFVEHEERNIRTVVEPTCGLGSFLRAAAEIFGQSATYFGFDINRDYIGSARAALREVTGAAGHVECQDFYQKDWKNFFSKQSATVDVLKRVDLKKLSERVGEEAKAIKYLSSPALESCHQRLLVFEKEEEYRIG